MENEKTKKAIFICVTSAHTWGMGPDPFAAIKNARVNFKTEFSLRLVITEKPDEVYVDQMDGSLWRDRQSLMFDLTSKAVTMVAFF